MPAGIVAGQLLELGVEADRVLHHPRQRERRAELADEPGRVPRRAVGELELLDEQRVGPPELRQVVEDRAADDAAADHDRPRALRNHSGVTIDMVIDVVPELRNATSVAPLPGGLTNTNFRVDTPSGAYVVRIFGHGTSLLAIDRENEEHNSRAAAEAGVGAPVVTSLDGALVLGLLEGVTLSAEDLRRGDRLELVAAACRRLHGARAFLRDFDMFEIQRRYLTVVRERGFRLPDRYDEFEDEVRAISAAMAVRREPR